VKGTLKGTLNERLHLQPALSTFIGLPPSPAPLPMHDQRRIVSHETNSGAEDDCNRDGDNMTTSGSAAPAATTAGMRNDGNDDNDNDNGGDDDEPEG
jgi:hypothetical protein